MVGRLRMRRDGELQPETADAASYRPRPFALIYSLLMIAGLVGTVGVYALLVAAVPGASGNRLDAAKTALVVVGGSGALAGLYVAYRKQRTDEAGHIRDQDKLFTERYTQAVTQLGSTSAAVRLGGVYALARIADDSARDRSTCLSVLCAYLRMPYSPLPDPAGDPEREVRTTVQQVLAERLCSSHHGFWENASVNLRGAHLLDPMFTYAVVRTFDARNARFVGDVDFGGAIFMGRAFFDDATFDGITRFDHATFEDDVMFRSVEFGPQTTFREVCFCAAAVIADSTASGGFFVQKSTFLGLSVLGGMQFKSYADYSGSDFHEYVNFTRSEFTEKSGFENTVFRRGADFTAVSFGSDVIFHEANFAAEALFSEATFNGRAQFRGSRFDSVATFGASTIPFEAPGVENAPDHIDLAGAVFNGDVSFLDATFMGPAIFEGARFLAGITTEWPEGFPEPDGIVRRTP